MDAARASVPSRAAFGLLALGLLLITPLVFSRAFTDQFIYIKLLLTKGLVLAGALAFALSLIWGRSRWPGNSRLGLPLAMLVLAVLVSCVMSPRPAFSLLEAESFLAGPLWLAMLLIWGGGESRVRSLATLIALAASGVAAIALLQWAGHDPMLFGGYHVEWGTMRSSMRLYSTFGNPNLVAGYLIGAVFAALALAASSPTRRGRFFCAASVLIIFAAILGTRSRGAWLGLAAGLVVARKFWARGAEAAPTPGIVTLRAALLPAGLLITLASLAPNMQALISHLEGRLYLCRAAWPMFTEHPLFGGGWGMFQLRFLELQAQFLGAHPEYIRYWTHTRQLHNDLLQILLEAGAVGLVAFGWLLWSFAREVRSLSRRASRTERVWLAASVGGATAILVDSIFNFQLSVPPTFILLFTFLAIPQMLQERGPAGASVGATGRTRVALRWIASLTVLGVVLFLALGTVRRARAEHSLALGWEQERRGNPAAAEHSYRAGLALAPGDGPLHYALARSLYVQRQYVAALAEALVAGYTVSDSHLEVLKARIQDQMGFRSPALEAYRHALRLDPTLKSVRADVERLSE
ncbi:MAG: O-antigen ligase family protein [Terriglobia bacterium]